MPNHLHDWIQTYPDFPQKGILFYDISPIIEYSDRLRQVCELICDRIADWQPDVIVGIDSRGFLFATPVALMSDLGVVMVRKKGKLPGNLLEKSYSLEYGQSSLAVQSERDLNKKRVVLIDDLLATGGTLSATETLINMAGAQVVGIVVLVELTLLKGRSKCAAPIRSLQTYDK